MYAVADRERMSGHQDHRTIELPADLLSRAERRLPRTEFDTVEAYVTVVLEETLAHVESETDEDFAAADEAEVEDRLKSLGYLGE